MNFLGHAHLAHHGDDDFLFGNLIADGIKGAALGELSNAVAEGVRHHRQVDTFIDHHPLVMQLRRSAPSEHRRVVAIAFDLIWDHFLAQRSPEALIERSYQVLLQGRDEWPARLSGTLNGMINGDWLRGYKDFGFTCQAIAGIGRRLSGPNRLAASVPWLEQEYDTFERTFQQLWPEMETRFLSLRPGPYA
ncbi:acyl carrier protein phosphodiesterase [Phytohalomonas tamaricis]|uniref:acyl carrier protein phosphodiesterase n=1 Tax=Phytohalomonas tamaricis TaxID=2081032 RepID=UPI000D0BE4D7|nr:ACP phosphodiesterase [Phytohalomonas tamaricis]